MIGIEFGLLVAQVAVDIGSVDGFVTTGGPAGSTFGATTSVITAVDIEIVAGLLIVEVALQAEIGVALGEHLLIDRTVGVVAG